MNGCSRDAYPVSFDAQALLSAVASGSPAGPGLQAAAAARRLRREEGAAAAGRPAFKSLRDSFGFFGAQNHFAENQLSALLMEDFGLTVLADAHRT